MSTIRVEKNKGYSVINNTGLNDPNLSFKAKGILAYLLSKPDDWHCVPADLQKNSADGQKSIYSGLQELRKNGYMIKRPIRNDKHVIIEWEEVLYETPQDTAKQIYEEQKSRREVKKKEKKAISPKQENGIKPFSQNVDMENADMENGKILISTDLPSTDLPSTDLKETKTVTLSDINSEIVIMYKDIISTQISMPEKIILYKLQNTTNVEILKKAIAISAIQNKKSISYINAIIIDWIAKGLDTVDKINKYLLDWANKNKSAKEIKEEGTGIKSKKRGNFNSFEQRKYNFDELEKKLLGWQSKV